MGILNKFFGKEQKDNPKPLKTGNETAPLSPKEIVKQQPETREKESQQDKTWTQEGLAREFNDEILPYVVFKLKAWGHDLTFERSINIAGETLRQKYNLTEEQTMQIVRMAAKRPGQPLRDLIFTLDTEKGVNNREEGKEIPEGYFECPVPSGRSFCSDNACPCPEVEIPRGSGYVYIDKELVDFRRKYPRHDDAVRALRTELEAYQRRMREHGGRGRALVISRVDPILVCEQGAKFRKLDLNVSAADARHWWQTGLCPLRTTPSVGKVIKETDKNQAELTDYDLWHNMSQNLIQDLERLRVNDPYDVIENIRRKTDKYLDKYQQDLLKKGKL